MNELRREYEFLAAKGTLIVSYELYQHVDDIRWCYDFLQQQLCGHEWSARYSNPFHNQLALASKTREWAYKDDAALQTFCQWLERINEMQYEKLIRWPGRDNDDDDDVTSWRIIATFSP